MKVALFLPHLAVSGGQGVYCRCLLRALTDTASGEDAGGGFDVLVPAEPRRLFPLAGADESWRDLVGRPGVRMHVLEWPADLKLAEPLDRVLAGPLATIRPDVLHSSYYTGLLSAPCPQVVTFHDAGYLEHPDWYGENGRLRRATTQQLRGVLTRIVGDSEDARGRLERLIPFPAERTDAVLLPLTDPPEAFAQARAGSWPDVVLWPGGDRIRNWGRYVLCAVGAATGIARRRKNIPTAVRAFRQADTGGATLIIGSNGTVDERLLADVLPEGELSAGSQVGPAWVSADGRVRVVPDLPRGGFLAVMSRAAAVVYPSFYEGFGLPSVEAMACGVPLVAARATSIPEVAGDAAILVDPTDTAGFAGALERVLHDQAVAADLVERGRRRLERFTLARFAADNRAVYRAAVRG